MTEVVIVTILIYLSWFISSKGTMFQSLFFYISLVIPVVTIYVIGSKPEAETVADFLLKSVNMK